jgi:L-cystine transport system substrate-binding protein
MKTKAWVSILFVVLALTGCAEKTAEPAAKSAQVIKVAYAVAGRPVTYTDDNGRATGYEVEVLRLIDEALPEYAFEFIPTNDDDLLIGVESGKYDFGLKNAFYTESRALKYIFPEEWLGASAGGLLVRKEDAETVKDLSDVARLKKKLIPLSPQAAQHQLILKYNEEHPDNPVILSAADSFVVQNAPLLVAEGRYDADFNIKPTYTKLIEAEDGAYHNLYDKLVFNTFIAHKTWPLFNRNFGNLAAAYDKEIRKLKENGKIHELLLEFFGEDVSSYLAVGTKY